jgi:hypothetical protein
MTQRSRREKVASLSSLSAISGKARARGRLRSSRTAPPVVIARLDRAIQYAEAYRFHVAFCGILDRPHSRAMTERYGALVLQNAAAHSRGAISPELCRKRLPSKQGRKACLDNRAEIFKPRETAYQGIEAPRHR